jgi:hypothetical protein
MWLTSFILDVGLQIVYNFSCTPTALGVQSWREIASRGTGTEEVKYHLSHRIRGAVRPLRMSPWRDAYVRQKETFAFVLTF